VSFDKLNISGGKQFSIKGTVQAVFPPPDEQMDPSVTGAVTAAAGGSAGGAGASGVGGGGGMSSVGVVTDANSGSYAGNKAQGTPTPQSVGVHGFDNLNLEDGVLRSKGKNVKLGSGVRLIVRVDILG